MAAEINETLRQNLIVLNVLGLNCCAAFLRLMYNMVTDISRFTRIETELSGNIGPTS